MSPILSLKYFSGSTVLCSGIHVTAHVSKHFPHCSGKLSVISFVQMREFRPRKFSTQALAPWVLVAPNSQMAQTATWLENSLLVLNSSLKHCFAELHDKPYRATRRYSSHMPAFKSLGKW